MKNKVNFKLHVKKGDTVKVLSGNDKNKTGEVVSVDPKAYKAIVKGVNMVTKHVKPTQQKPDGEIIRKEAAIHLSKLMLVVNNQPTRIGRKLNDNNKLARYSKKTGEFID